MTAHSIAPLLLSVSVVVLMRTAAAENAMPSVTLETINVFAKKDVLKPVISEHDVYDKNESSVYKNKEQLEQFMGESPSDIFKGMTGVQSGDARNSGAIDPNVRGIQGQGRVPVTIDGTEQAITVYRGYSGANNRNYIDPLLISNVKVTKGASLEQGTHASVGGSVTINTLNVDDILSENDSFALNIKGVVGNNTTKAHAIDYENSGNLYAGDYSFDIYPEQDIYNPDRQQTKIAKQQAQQRRDEFLAISGDLPRRTVEGAVGKLPKISQPLLNGDDKAMRIVAAGKTQVTNQLKIDGLVAYTYRNRGNYFSGKHGNKDYRTDVSVDKRNTGDFSAYMADVYRPNTEVPNTSNRTESYLFKGTIRTNDDQALQLGIRHTETTYGDIMPSRITGDNASGSMYDLTGRLPQWPLSNVKLDSYYLQYRYDPIENPWLDIHANLWQTKSILNTNSAGGYPFVHLGIIGQNSKVNFKQYQQGMINQFKQKFPEVVNCTEAEIRSLDTSTLCGQLSVLYGSNAQIKGDALLKTYNNRTGFSLSNKTKLTKKLDLTLSGNWQKEKLYSDEVVDKVGGDFVALPRAGRRKAWDISANFNFNPTSKWNIQAGVSYNNYWAFDDLLSQQRQQGKFPNKSSRVIGYELLYYQLANQAVQDMLSAYNKNIISQAEYESFIKEQYPKALTSIEQIYGRKTHFIENGQAGKAYIQHQYVWKADKQGNFSRNNNPFFNGEAHKNHWLRTAKVYEMTKDTLKGSGQAVPIVADVTVGEPFKDAKKHQAWAVTPTLAIAYQINNDIRTYMRYAQATRMPSLYESTLGFSIQSMDNENQIKPEKGTNIEFGYVQDLTRWFKNARYADVKLAYYHNRIKDIIDRTDEFKLKNFDYQTIAGIELQSRFDNGNWFGDFSVSHTLKQQVCDANYAVTQDPYYAQVPDCVKYGFGFGYLQNMGQPNWQVDLTLAKRLLENKLTLGTRIHYHSGADKNINAHNYGYSNEGTLLFNTPINWSSALTIDGFATYKATKNLTFELSGTNLTNQYYIDPLSRTLMPAPGRALLAKAEIKF